jgi:NYN domain
MATYTGALLHRRPHIQDDAPKNAFWAAKLLQMSRAGIHVFSRPLRYRNQRFKLSDGTEHTVLVGQEKGIDVRLALDIVAAAYGDTADVLLVFSQDQDLSEVADEVRRIATGQGRWLKIASAFPFSPTTTNSRGINNSDWIRIDRATYDGCIDSRDYRPKEPTP